MAVAQVDVSNQIVAFKRKLAPRREALKRAYADVRDHVRRTADIILRDVNAGRSVVPELDYRDIRNSTVPEAIRQLIRNTGCAVRGVFPSDLARNWFAEVGEYLETNHYEQREVEKRTWWPTLSHEKHTSCLRHPF